MLPSKLRENKFVWHFSIKLLISIQASVYKRGHCLVFVLVRSLSFWIQHLAMPLPFSYICYIVTHRVLLLSLLLVRNKVTISSYELHTIIVLRTLKFLKIQAIHCAQLIYDSVSNCLILQNQSTFRQFYNNNSLLFFLSLFINKKYSNQGW